MITPDTATAYFISGPVDISPNVINITNPGVALLGFNRATDALITNSLAPLLSSTNQNLPLTGFTLINTNPAGDLINLNNSGSSVVIFDKMFFGACGSIGTIGDFQNIIFDNCGINSATPIGGVSFTGTSHTEILTRDSFFNNWTGTMFDLGTATSMFIEFVGTRFLGLAPTDVAIDGMAAAGNIQVGGLGTISTCLFSGMTNPVGLNLSHDDSGWFFTDVVGIQESAFLGEIAMANNLTDTVIGGTNVWTKVAGTTVTQPGLERFSQTASNELQADVLLPRPITLTANISAVKSGGGTDIVQFTVFKDSGGGFVQLSTDVISSISATTSIASTSIILTDIANPGDKYSVYTQNTSSVSNVEVNDLQFLIRG